MRIWGRCCYRHHTSVTGVNISGDKPCNKGPRRRAMLSYATGKAKFSAHDVSASDSRTHSTTHGWVPASGSWWVIRFDLTCRIDLTCNDDDDLGFRAPQQESCMASIPADQTVTCRDLPWVVWLTCCHLTWPSSPPTCRDLLWPAVTCRDLLWPAVTCRDLLWPAVTWWTDLLWQFAGGRQDEADRSVSRLQLGLVHDVHQHRPQEGGRLTGARLGDTCRSATPGGLPSEGRSAGQSFILHKILCTSSLELYFKSCTTGLYTLFVRDQPPRWHSKSNKPVN